MEFILIYNWPKLKPNFFIINEKLILYRLLLSGNFALLISYSAIQHAFEFEIHNLEKSNQNLSFLHNRTGKGHPQP